MIDNDINIEVNDNNEDNINYQEEEEEIHNNTMNGLPHKKERVGLIRLPLAKIKNIMKIDEDIKLCQKNAYYVIGRMTELFIQELSKNAQLAAKSKKRKTINLEDICIIFNNYKHV